jgi:hypothetical protein
MQAKRRHQQRGFTSVPGYHELRLHSPLEKGLDPPYGNGNSTDPTLSENGQNPWLEIEDR